MNPEYFHPYDNSRLWTGNLILLTAASFLLYASVYMLLPAVPIWLMQSGFCNYTEIAGSVALFGVGVFLPGMFNSFLIDRFRRKHVCLLSLLGLLALTWLYPYTSSLWQIAALRVGQGALFGIATMTLGSTLAIDVTASHRRTSANVALTWMNRLGMALGLSAGVFAFSWGGIQTAVYASVMLGGVAVLLTLFVRVAFRAPLQPPLLSLDRFLLPRSLYPAVCLMLIASVLGVLAARVYTEFFYLFLAGGFILASIVVGRMLQRMSGRVRMELGTASLVSGFLAFLLWDTLTGSYLSAVLLGAGIGLCASCLYAVMIEVALHCERGTANNTYQLFWELGIAAGVLLEACLGEAPSTLYLASLCLCALVLLIYELSLHKWYNKQLENKIL